MSASTTEEIAAAAARLVVEEGMEYGPAKRRAGASARACPGPRRDAGQRHRRGRGTRLPRPLLRRHPAGRARRAARGGHRLDDPARGVPAAPDRRRLARAPPHGSSNVHLQLYCDDSKEAELALIDRRVDYEVGTLPGPRGEPIDVLSVAHTSTALGERVTVHLSVLDHDDLRGALKPDATGRPQRGDLAALQRLMAAG